MLADPPNVGHKPANLSFEQAARLLAVGATTCHLLSATNVLDDVTVSRRHAEFRLDKDGSWAVADVGSLNGTYVNRQPVDSTVRANNDEVQIGKFRLVFLTG